MNEHKKKIGRIGRNMSVPMYVTSIQANAKSLLGQLQDYSFLYVTVDELEQLEKFEREFHALVRQITERTS